MAITISTQHTKASWHMHHASTHFQRAHERQCFRRESRGLIYSEQGQGLEGDCRRDQHELTKNLSKGSLVAYQKCLESTTRFLTTMIVRLLKGTTTVQFVVWGWKVSECKFWKILFGNHAFYTSGIPQAVKVLGLFTSKQIAFTMNK